MRIHPQCFRKRAFHDWSFLRIVHTPPHCMAHAPKLHSHERHLGSQQRETKLNETASRILHSIVFLGVPGSYLSCSANRPSVVMCRASDSCRPPIHFEVVLCIRHSSNAAAPSSWQDSCNRGTPLYFADFFWLLRPPNHSCTLFYPLDRVSLPFCPKSIATPYVSKHCSTICLGNSFWSTQRKYYISEVAMVL